MIFAQTCLFGKTSNADAVLLLELV